MISDADLIAAVTAYKVALRWSSTDAAGIEYDSEKYEIYSFSEDAQAQTTEDVTRFIAENLEYIRAFMEVTGRGWGDVGHDIALTRNHHGTGFWDRGAAGPAVDALVAASHALGAVYPYLSDDDDEIELELG